MSPFYWEMLFGIAGAVLAAVSLFPILGKFRGPVRWLGFALAIGALFLALDKGLSWHIPAENASPAVGMGLRVAFWLAGAIFGAALLKYSLRRWVFPHDGQPRARKLFADLLAGLIYLIAGLGILNTVVGSSLSGLLATSGVVAVFVGLALQNTLADLFAGLALNIERPFRAGDWITMGEDVEGQIQEINWRAARLKTRSGTLVVVPNSLLAHSIAVNHHRPGSAHYVSTKITFDADVDPDSATKVLIEAANGISLALRKPSPTVSLLSWGPAGIVYELDFCIANYADVPAATNEALRNIWRMASTKGLMPVNAIQDVHLVNSAKHAETIASTHRKAADSAEKVRRSPATAI